MRIALLLGVLATASAQTGTSCLSDAGCPPTGYYCRAIGSTSTGLSCQPYVQAGLFCTTYNPIVPFLERRCDPGQGLTCDPTTQLCKAGNTPAAAGVVAGVVVPATGMVCGADSDCGSTGFCKLTSTVTGMRNCAPRIVLGQMCTYSFVDPTTELRCLASLTCQPNPNAPPQINALTGTCQQTATGQTCSSDTDCGSTSLFCKRVSATSTVKNCFTKGVQGDKCSKVGYVSEWNVATCLDTLACSLLDFNNPGLGGVCTTGGAVCLIDSDCGDASKFCRTVSSTSQLRQCYKASTFNQPCTISAFTPAWLSQPCADPQTLTCQEIDPNNPSLGGTCVGRILSCTGDLDCDPRQFCRRTSSSSQLKQCYDRSILADQCSSAGFVPEWNEKACSKGLQCVLTSTSNPSIGGFCKNQTACSSCDTIASPVCAGGQEYYNSCQAKCNGLTVWTSGPCNAQGCKSNADCQSDSFFCKRAMITSSFQSCFLRSTEGQPCTWPGYASDWNNQTCLNSLFCVLTDQNSPGLGGTCQAQQTGCSVDSDCRSSSQFCKRASSSSGFSSCFARSSQSQDCTIGTSVPEWNVKKCLATLYCYPLNYNNPSAGGVCQSNTFYGSNGPTNVVASTGYVAAPATSTIQYMQNANSPLAPPGAFAATQQTPAYSNSVLAGTTQYSSAQYSSAVPAVGTQNYYGSILPNYPTQYNNGYPPTYSNSYNFNTFPANSYNTQFQYSYNTQPFNYYGSQPMSYNTQPINYNTYNTQPGNYYTTQAVSNTAVFSSCSRGCGGAGVPSSTGKVCYCDSACAKGGDCCPDYNQFCGAYRSGGAGTTLFNRAIIMG